MKKIQQIYDLSPPITTDLKVWPGDTPFSTEVLCHLEDGASVTLSTIKSTVHLGSHADAPMHYDLGGEDIAIRDLNYYIGQCQVISVNIGRGERIKPHHLGNKEIVAERVLLVTNTFPDFKEWNEDFAALSPELVEYLHSKGVILIGIDTPSVDLMDSKDLPSHKSLATNNMAVLEGLVMEGVPEGVFELIALPLKLVGVDGSPVRAILRR